MQVKRCLCPWRSGKPGQLSISVGLVIKLFISTIIYINNLNMNIRDQIDPLQSFKQEIQGMFEKSFQELTLKNNLNKTILSNLMQAARDQEQKIAHLDRNIQSLKMIVNPDTNLIKGEINRQQNLIYDNFNRMMSKLNQIEQGITNSKKHLEQYVRNNGEVNHKLEIMTNKLQKIQREEGGFEYRGNQEDLMAEVQDFQKIMAELQQNNKGIMGQIDFNQKIQLQEPLNTFQTKMMLHNKNNEEVLRTKLRDFTQKLKKIEKKVEQTTWAMNSQFTKSSQQQKRIVQEMNLMEGEMMRLRSQLQDCDVKRKQTMQSSAATLDNLVEQMLSQAKKLQVRVDSLRKGYEGESQKLKKDSFRR